MKCPLCDIEAQITKNRVVMIGDKLYRRLTYSCRNKQCSNNGKEIGTIDVPMTYTKIDEGENE